MRIRPARADEAADLSELAFRAKAHWGYSDAFMAACRAELTVAPEAVSAGGHQVIEDGDRACGFYALRRVSPTAMELEALFVDPPRIGEGFGRALLEHALESCAAAGIERLVIQADPHSVEFYQRAGAVEIAERASGSIAGRMLPLLEIRIKTAPAEG
ncbi:MAG: GNAT family N-acetyltransferase [Pseudomonadales bacterium]